MTDQTPISREDRVEKLKGVGSQRKRVEDARFTQGKGNYVDDIKLPGMLFGDFVRSPYAHARVVSINKDEALKVPGVLAVLTAADLAPLGLHWMPTLAGDRQMVLADGKVLFQGQEVAFVVATDRYAAADGIEAVEVEYAELPVVVDPFKALAPDAPVLREDLEGKMTGAHGPRKHHNHIFTWEQGDQAATEAVIASADVVAEEMVYYHRTHPCPLEPCGCVASMDKVNGKLTLWGTFQAPHAIRTVVSLISGIEEHNIRVISPDIGGGFGNKVGAYSGYVCSVVASIVTGKPVKWIEDRMDNLMTTAFARDYWMKGKIAATKEGKITGLWCHVTADHGGFDACADPTKFPAGFFNICTGSYDIPRGLPRGGRRLHQQGAGGRGLPLLLPRDGSRLLHRADDRDPRHRARHGRGRTAPDQLHPEGAVSLPLRARLGIRLGRLPHGLGEGAEGRGLRGAP
jgi:aerobic carbon-monoxide dehydrogenase large subunit